MSKKAWIIFAAVCVAILGSLVYFSSKNNIDVSGIDGNKIQPANAKSGGIADHTFGQANSKVILIEYGDFQCPYCGQDYPGIKAIAQKYQGQISFVFRNFPLTSRHPNALTAAAAAEAAGLQGKYWQMHDVLYNNQSEWGDSTSMQRTSLFQKYATNIGLNVNTFTSDLASNSVSQKISFDQALGAAAQVSATPTLFLDGTKVDDTTAATQTKLNTAVANELKKQGIALPTISTN